jgi:hypothetical protein
VNVLKESGDPYRTAALGHDHFSTAKA